jgi:hypothetical protein
MTLKTETQYQYLEPRPGSNYRSLFLKGRRIRAAVVDETIHGPDPFTPEEFAREYPPARRYSRFSTMWQRIRGSSSKSAITRRRGSAPEVSSVRCRNEVPTGSQKDEINST